MKPKPPKYEKVCERCGGKNFTTRDGQLLCVDCLDRNRISPAKVVILDE